MDLMRKTIEELEYFFLLRQESLMMPRKTLLNI